MDTYKYRYRKFISDISGQDIFAHGNSPKKAIRGIREWLKIESKRTTIPGGDKIYKRYLVFQKDLPLFCKKRHLRVKELTFVDYSEAVSIWLQVNPLYTNK